MKNQERLIKVSMNNIWYLFRIYLNDPNYLVKNTDVLANKFGNGEKDVKEFVKQLNGKISSVLGIEPIKYSKRITYQQLLKQITTYYERTEI